MKDAFRERLSGIAPRGEGGTQPGRRGIFGRRTRVEPRTLAELPGVVRAEGVLVVERSAGDLAGASLDELLGALDRSGRLAIGRDDLDPEVRALLEHPDAALFIDTETTGLAGNMVFLLGAMRVSEERGLTVTQVFARDYTEERALLEAWLDLARNAGMLVSFNGKAFDVPLLKDRLGLHRLPAPADVPHVDLLHHARRRWRTVLPDCRLQTLEWQLCGRRRAGDIPGEEIPEVYHRFVQTGDARDVLTVFHHNALDLLTLADVALALAAPEDGPP